MTGVEWETGNISSSHRALNKMVLALMEGRISQGVLAMPVRSLAAFLTDRVGNFEEIRPYLPVFGPPGHEGRLLILTLAQDGNDAAVPVIGKGTDGRALR